MKTNTVIIILLSLILVFVGVIGTIYLKQWHDQRVGAEAERRFFTGGTPPPPPLTPFQHKMMSKGYGRDHATNNWYPLNEIFSHHCLVTGPPLETTFQCAQPLTEGIPDQE